MTGRTELSIERLLANAPGHVALFDERTARLGHEKKGIRRSEMFFLFAAVAEFQPRRILESGRARGQSALVLARCFPAASIISIENDERSPDAHIGVERLEHLPNVECRFGDSRVLLPPLLAPEDIVLIDGPKDFRALKLALRLLATGKPRAVFVHDLWLGSRVRQFVARHLPDAFLSDDARFVRRYSYLDSSKQPSLPPGDSAGHVRYGATLACFPRSMSNAKPALRRVPFAQVNARTREIISKLLRRPTPFVKAAARLDCRDHPSSLHSRASR